jgi:hypothetical protein
MLKMLPSQATVLVRIEPQYILHTFDDLILSFLNEKSRFYASEDAILVLM